jgi:hypothetical protein
MTGHRQPPKAPPIRTENLNCWYDINMRVVTIHTGTVPSQGEVVATVFSNGDEALRMAAANNMYLALQECHKVIQAHLADTQTLAGREGTKAMNLARTALSSAESNSVQPIKRHSKHPNSTTL